ALLASLALYLLAVVTSYMLLITPGKRAHGETLLWLSVLSPLAGEAFYSFHMVNVMNRVFSSGNVAIEDLIITLLLLGVSLSFLLVKVGGILFEVSKDIMRDTWAAGVLALSTLLLSLRFLFASLFAPLLLLMFVLLLAALGLVLATLYFHLFIIRAVHRAARARQPRV
ncbi:MAG: hypothetical protein ABWK01_01575, partial [Infirmifilum sp.]